MKSHSSTSYTRGGSKSGQGRGRRKVSELSSLGPGLPALPNGGQGIDGVARYTLQQLIVTTELLVPNTSYNGGVRGRNRRLQTFKAGQMFPAINVSNSSDERPQNGSSFSQSEYTSPTDPSAAFRLRMRPLTKQKKYGAVPAPPGDGSNPWDYCQLLRHRRSRIQQAKKFHKRRRAEFARLVLNSCRKLRATHRPSPPDLSNALSGRLTPALKVKYSRILMDLFQELREREVQPVLMKPLGTYEKYCVPGVERVPWVSKERRALSRAMASFPPTVRTVMSHALRPLDTLTLVDVNDGGGLVSSGEGVELSVLITRWRATARAGRTQLRSSWFSQSVSAIREAALTTNLSPSRRHAVMHAFNNLLASKVNYNNMADRHKLTGNFVIILKFCASFLYMLIIHVVFCMNSILLQLQEVLIRSIECILKWLGSEEEPWVGPRVKLYLVLDENEIILQPDEVALYSAFMDLFKEVGSILNLCIQL
ncbi:hypothetical protein SK128_017533 [Halocaridina rubra]|uniref:Uncharacterized protein n=1 Tax=Halocaridina rubra TaxID=373956 RepID=A0AAN9AAT9_HALRR